MSPRLRRLVALSASLALALATLVSTQALALASPSRSAAAQAPGLIGTLSPLADPSWDASRPGAQVGGTPPYLDDRSSGPAAVVSYYNALHRGEYDRAYSYWAPSLVLGRIGNYESFKAGFADTRAFSVALGQTRVDHAAGQIYNYVPVALSALQADGSTRAYAICFALHLPNPQIQDNPPFDPWAIESARVTRLAAGADPQALLDSACAGMGVVQPTASPSADPNDISSARYLDDRSTPEEVLRSLFSAVNRREYDRAYSYWAASAAGLAPYPTFAAGYSDTASVKLTFGQTRTEGAAGQLYFEVPVTLVAQNTKVGTQTYVGCYTLHLSQPATQDQPPFGPMSIIAAKVTQVSNSADTAAVMARACPVG